MALGFWRLALGRALGCRTTICDRLRCEKLEKSLAKSVDSRYKQGAGVLTLHTNFYKVKMAGPLCNDTTFYKDVCVKGKPARSSSSSHHGLQRTQRPPMPPARWMGLRTNACSLIWSERTVCGERGGGPTARPTDPTREGSESRPHARPARRLYGSVHASIAFEGHSFARGGHTCGRSSCP